MNRSVSSVLSNDTNIFSNHSITVFDHSPTAADRQFQRGRWQKINKKPSGENGKQEMKQEFRKRHINPRSSHRRRPPEDPLKRCLSTEALWVFVSVPSCSFNPFHSVFSQFIIPKHEIRCYAGRWGVARLSDHSRRTLDLRGVTHGKLVSDEQSLSRERMTNHSSADRCLKVAEECCGCATPDEANARQTSVSRTILQPVTYIQCQCRNELVLYVRLNPNLLLMFAFFVKSEIFGDYVRVYFQASIIAAAGAKLT